MPGGRGVHWYLKDRETQISDKLKIARFTWKNDSIHLHNKHQVVLDWLSTSLHNRKKFPAKDVEGIWHTLHDVLHTRAAHQVSSTGQGLLIKNSLLQAVMSELTKQKRDHVTVDGSLLLGICNKIIMSPALFPSLLTRWELPIQMLGALVEFSSSRLQQGAGLSDPLVPLMTTLITKCQKLFQHKLSAQQTVSQVSSRLLQQAFTLIAQLKGSPEHTGQEETLAPALKRLIAQALFNKDLQEFYSQYLRFKLKETKASPPKMIDGVFMKINQLYQEQETTEAGRLLVMWFYQQFIQKYHNRTVENSLGFQCMQYLCSILNIGETTKDESDSDCDTPCILTLNDLLHLGSDNDVYTLAGDQAESQKKWLTGLFLWVLKQKQRDPCWYQCIEHILNMDYSIVEKKIPVVLRETLLLKDEVETHVKTSQDNLLCSLVSVYDKLRQIYKLVKKICEAIREYEVTHLNITPKFHARLVQCFELLPQSLTVDIWKMLQEEVALYIREKKYEDRKVHGLLELFSLYLANIRVVDYSITHQTAAQVASLVRSTGSDVIRPLLMQASENKDVGLLVSSLQFTTTWAQLRLLLVRYANYTEDSQSDDPKKPAAKNFTCVVPCLNESEWNQVISVQHTVTDNQAQIKYCMIQLQMTMVKAMLLSKECIESEIKELVGSVCQTLQPFDRDDELVSWDGKVTGIDVTNLPVAHWKVILDNISLMAPFLSDGHLSLISSQLLRSLEVEESTPSTETVPGLTSLFLSSSIIHELPALTSHLVSQVWKAAADCYTETKGKSPKKTSSLVKDSLEQVANIFCMSDMERAKKAIEKLGGLFHTDLVQPAKLKSASYTRLTKLMKVFKHIPLESLEKSSQLSNFLGFYFLLYTTCYKAKHLQNHHLELIQTCSQLLIQLLDGMRGTRLFSVVQAGTLLQMLSGLRQDIPEDYDAAANNLDEITDKIWRDALLDVDGVKSAMETIGQVTQDMNECIKNNTGDWSAILPTARDSVLAFTCVTRILLRSYLKKETKDPCLTAYNNTEPAILKLLTTIIGKKGKMKDVPQEWVLVCLQAFTAVVCFHFSIQKNKTHDSGAIYMSLLEPICQLCHRSLKKTADVSRNVSAALMFISHVCHGYSALKDNLPSLWLNKTFTATLHLLENSWSQKTAYTLRLPTPVQTPGKSKNKSLTSKDDHMTFMDQSQETNLLDVQEIYQCLIEDNAMDTSDVIEEQQSGDEVSNHDNHKMDMTSSSEIDTVLVRLVQLMDESSLKEALRGLLCNLDPGVAKQKPECTLVSLHVFTVFVDARLSEEGTDLFMYASQTMLQKINSLLQQLSPASSRRQVIISALDAVTAVVAAGTRLLGPQQVATSLQCCYHTQLAGLSHEAFYCTFQSVFNLLSTVMLRHAESVYKFIPAYLLAVKSLLRAVIQEGKQTQVARTESETKDLIGCAQMIDRLFALLNTHKTDFAKVSGYIIADYVHEVQKVTLLPPVKKALLAGVYNLVDICDVYTVAQLHTVLPPGEKEIFKTIYGEFKTYHKYSGRV